MGGTYRVVVRGRILESGDLKKLLSRAVAEKKVMDQRLGMFLGQDLMRLPPLPYEAQLRLVERRLVENWGRSPISAASSDSCLNQSSCGSR